MTDSSLIPSAFLPVGHDCLCRRCSCNTHRQDGWWTAGSRRAWCVGLFLKDHISKRDSGGNKPCPPKPVYMFVFVATMFPGDKSTPWKVHFPFEWCKICKEHTLAGCFRLTAASTADSRPVLEQTNCPLGTNKKLKLRVGVADGIKCPVTREGFGWELLLLQIERIQMRWPLG